jgi:succinate-acetate transporter protein
MLSLSVASLLLGCLQIGAIDRAESHQVALIVLGFTVPLQLTSAVLCFLSRDTVAGGGLGLFAGAWLASALVLLTSPPGATSTAFGVFLVALAGALLVIVGGAAGGKAGPAAVLVVGAGRFFLAGLYDLIASSGLEHAAAIVGFVLVPVAVYSALATEVEDVHGRSPLPIGRRRRAALAMRGGFFDQLEGLAREAGVRQQL